MYVEVILAKPASGLDKAFHYSVPPQLIDQIKIGSQILIPFGNRQEIGYVVGFVESPQISKVKSIIEIRREIPFFTKEAIVLAIWIAKYYLAFFITALRLFMPPGTTLSEKNIKTKRKKVKTNKIEKNMLIEEKKELTKDQQIAYEGMKKYILEKKYATFLLFGITGSGKTEVYLHLIDFLLNQNKSAIVLVPEIGLTTQLIERFEKRFGNQVSFLHGGMTIKQKKEQWERILKQEARVVLGTKLALFAPLKEIGAIVIDEEYEITYKQEKSPRFHTRKVAEHLAKIHNIPLILGSATPSIETYFKAITNQYSLFELPNRIDNRPLPKVQIVDMKEEIKKNKDRLSTVLKKELKHTLTAGKQAILYLNRLGFFTFVRCLDCGEILKCSHCSVSLVYNSKNRTLRCNRCGFVAKAPLVCSKCQSTKLRFRGSGTERLEEEIRQIFPKARIARLDSNVSKKKNATKEIYNDFISGKIDVLIGTQLVTKGLDVGNVTLIGVISADTGLFLPDFRATEHAFQELTQVAGRAGRGNLAGKVIFQTFNPDHYAIICAASHDYKKFYEEEIVNRENLFYPPYSELINIIISSSSSERSEEIAQKISMALKTWLKDKDQVMVLGPSPAVIPRIRDNYRYSILLKSKAVSIIRSAVEQALPEVVKLKDVRITVDVDPVNFF